MNKPLTPRLHGFIDYAVVLAFVLVPNLAGFSETPSTICYALAAVHLTMTLLTAFPLGVASVIPFTVHGAIEAVVAAGLVAVPWLFGFAAEDAARNFFLVAAASIAVVWVLTNYRAASYATLTRGHRTPSYV